MSVSNSNLAYLTSVLGRSYSCNSEQSLIITEAVSINTFRLQVQPFAVISNQFATGRPVLALYLQWGCVRLLTSKLRIFDDTFFHVKCFKGLAKALYMNYMFSTKRSVHEWHQSEILKL